MTEEQKEAFEAVEKINDELFEKYNKLNRIDMMPILSITFAGSYLFIGLTLISTNECDLPELRIYHSENNDRIYYEKSNKYESFYRFIKRKFLEIKEEINSVKL